MTERLFAYGTLNPELAPPAIAPIVARFSFLGAGFVTGLLFDLGAYHGAVQNESSPGRIVGKLYEIPFDIEIWRMLDDYEGYDPENMPGSLFVRSLVNVTVESGCSEAWMYAYNGDVSGLVPVNKNSPVDRN